jgi:3-hydroxyisobutyrate dehydrogenase
MLGEIMDAITRVGFIGLGNMGGPMAARLSGAGFDLAIFDSDSKALQGFARQYGIQPAGCIRELGAGAEAVITMLPDGQVVKKVVQGDDENHRDVLMDSMSAGAVLVDMSSSAPGGTQNLGKRLAAHGIHMLDAPVSGGVPRAVAGTLAIMAGGEPDVVSRCMPLFNAMGDRIFETGPLGSGHAMKVLNNMVSAAGLIAAAEALLIGSHFDLKPEVMINILNASTGRNNSTENKFKQFIFSRTFNSGFSLDLMVKDLTTALELSREKGVPAIFSGVCRELWATARSRLENGADHTAVVRWFEEMADFELKEHDKV